MSRRHVVPAVAVVASVAVLAVFGIARAETPPMIYDTIRCEIHADATGGASTQAGAGQGTLSPSGRGPADEVHIIYTVRNVLGAPLAGATVSAQPVAVGGSTVTWDNGLLPPGDVPEAPQTGVSDGSGTVQFMFDEAGASVGAYPTLPNLDVAITIRPPAGAPYAGLSCSPRLSVISYDLDASGVVNLVDFARFGGDMGSGSLRSDFNWNGRMDLTDFALFGANMGASLDAQ